MSMKPSDGYRLSRGYMLGSVIGLGLALPFILTPNAVWFLAALPAVGGPIGWAVAFLQMGGDLD